MKVKKYTKTQEKCASKEGFDFSDELNYSVDLTPITPSGFGDGSHRREISSYEGEVEKAINDLKTPASIGAAIVKVLQKEISRNHDADMKLQNYKIANDKQSIGFNIENTHRRGRESGNIYAVYAKVRSLK